MNSMIERSSCAHPGAVSRLYPPSHFRAVNEEQDRTIELPSSSSCIVPHISGPESFGRYYDGDAQVSAGDKVAGRS